MQPVAELAHSLDEEEADGTDVRILLVDAEHANVHPGHVEDDIGES